MGKQKYTVSKEQLQQLYERELKTIDQVAEVIGCHPSSVRLWLVKNGVAIRPKGRRPSDTSFEAARHREYGRRYRSKMSAEKKTLRRERQRQRRGSVIKERLSPDERERRRQETHARYREKHHARLAANHRERRKREEVKASERRYRQANRERLTVMNREWRKTNPEKVMARREARRDEINANHREYVARRMQEDVQFKLARQLRSRMNAAVRGGYRAGSAVEDLGMPIAAFKEYLESLWEPKMSWDNYGKGAGKWCIDHVYPLAKADFRNRLEVLAVANWRNQVPRWHTDNSSKLATVTPEAAKLFQELQVIVQGSM
jgi:hypothetical protein